MTYGQIDENMVRMRVKQTIEILVKNDKYVFVNIHSKIWSNYLFTVNCCWIYPTNYAGITL